MPRGIGKPPVNPKNALLMKKPDESEYVKYTVKKGDTVQSIAEKFDLDPYDLARFIMEKEGKETLYEGQEIELPLLSNGTKSKKS